MIDGKTLREIAFQYFDDIEKAKKFMTDEYGDVNFLREKNGGIIPRSNYDIKGSRIKGFSFHGSGCGFQTKKYSFDVQFDLETGGFGFTAWSLYMYLNAHHTKEVTEKEAFDLLEEFILELLVSKKNNVYIQVGD